MGIMVDSLLWVMQDIYIYIYIYIINRMENLTDPLSNALSRRICVYIHIYIYIYYIYIYI